MIIELILILVTITLFWYFNTRKPDKFPPGPPKWPIVGNRLQLKSWGALPHLAMGEAARRYGDVVGLFSGKIPVVLVSSLEAIKEVSSREDFSARPRSKLMEHIDQGSFGVLWISGEKWKDQRRFTLRNLKDLGFGKRSLEGIAHEELEAVFAEIEKISGGQKERWSHPVPVHDILGTAGINVLWHIIAGKRYSHTDPYLQKLMSNVKLLIKMTEPGGGPATAFPFLTKILPFLSNLQKILKLRASLQNFIKQEIKKHRESFDGDNPRDFIDTYINEVDKNRHNHQTWYEEKQLVMICVDLFMAGSDTTFNSLTFSMLYMILYPEVLSKVQEELDKVVGRDRLPSLEDRPSLPYVEATINEVLRLSTVAPLAVPHSPWYAEKDAELQGYIIPKNSRVILNLHAVHHDPKIWVDPQNFRPERFLDKNGKLIKHEAFIPFGAGKRQCLGEALARNNLFLFFSGLAQKYYISVPEGHPTPSNEVEGGLTVVPKAFEVRFQPRG
ncbi:methyl farnesoate epoxidase-like [Ischnura elegans]|uniref:methyl farnesoate epoxidase-like n=1 Tax=Ischnura elegans TaxID=197161 RepID=UPI001ED86B90|nr:methyl farnesoate epoxidase-like [Ischnura elegans]